MIFGFSSSVWKRNSVANECWVLISSVWWQDIQDWDGAIKRFPYLTLSSHQWELVDMLSGSMRPWLASQDDAGEKLYVSDWNPITARERYLEIKWKHVSIELNLLRFEAHYFGARMGGASVIWCRPPSVSLSESTVMVTRCKYFPSITKCLPGDWVFWMNTRDKYRSFKYQYTRVCTGDIHTMHTQSWGIRSDNLIGLIRHPIILSHVHPASDYCLAWLAVTAWLMPMRNDGVWRQNEFYPGPHWASSVPRWTPRPVHTGHTGG